MDNHSALQIDLDDVDVLRININKFLCSVSVERYNVDNLPVFEKYVKCQAAAGNFYDLEANLAVLKLYQLFPRCYNPDIVYLILAKALTNLPHNDFDLCRCLLGVEQFHDPGIQRLCYFDNLLEMCKFQTFWEEKSKEPGRIDEVSGFDDSIRIFICKMVSILFKNMKEPELTTVLGCKDDQELQKCMQSFDWEKGSNEVVNLFNQEGPGKAKNVAEKINLYRTFSTLINVGKTGTSNVETGNIMIPTNTTPEQKATSSNFDSGSDSDDDLSRKPSEESENEWIYVKNKTPYNSKRSTAEGIVTGKWLIFEPMDKIDETWKEISTAVAKGILGCSAKVSTIADNEVGNPYQDQDDGVICVYTYDHNDEYDVMRVRAALRRMGFTRQLAYKTDQTTLQGKYSWNSKKRVSKYYC
ncbi:unnamed protein product [Orchesella dallaii]|uniref:Eukaryotic translation initiation factor 3 subunit K n=1 Tax=Orchesella dallaii TaxID=48710 RepID=A0ABP1R813_9HEXA